MTISRRVLKYVRPYWPRLAFSMFCSMVFSLFSGISIYLTIPLLETLFGKGSGGAPAAVTAPGSSLLPGWLLSAKDSIASGFQQLLFRATPSESLLNICIVVVIAFFIKNIFGYLQSNTMVFVEQGLIKDLRNDLYRHIHELPLAYFTNERTGNLISRIMNDVPVINTGISATFATLIKEPLLIVVYLTICLVISWQLTLVSFVVFPLVLLIIAGVGRRVHNESRLVQERIADLISILHETISGVKVVKAFGM
jgi:subfamily B ATP-binding cassette protein MsbA